MMVHDADICDGLPTRINEKQAATIDPECGPYETCALDVPIEASIGQYAY